MVLVRPQSNTPPLQAPSSGTLADLEALSNRIIHYPHQDYRGCGFSGFPSTAELEPSDKEASPGDRGGAQVWESADA